MRVSVEESVGVQVQVRVSVGVQVEVTGTSGGGGARHRRGEQVERLACDGARDELLGREGGAQPVEAAQLLDEAGREPVDGVVLAAVERAW